MTGAPKVRAMEIIRELEPWPRDAYCGAIGWAAPDGRAAFNVAIRTLTLYRDGSAVLNVGGGVVANSTADSSTRRRCGRPVSPTLPDGLTLIETFGWRDGRFVNGAEHLARLERTAGRSGRRSTARPSTGRWRRWPAPRRCACA